MARSLMAIAGDGGVEEKDGGGKSRRSQRGLWPVEEIGERLAAACLLVVHRRRGRAAVIAGPFLAGCVEVHLLEQAQIDVDPLRATTGVRQV